VIEGPGYDYFWEEPTTHIRWKMMFGFVSEIVTEPISQAHFLKKLAKYTHQHRFIILFPISSVFYEHKINGSLNNLFTLKSLPTESPKYLTKV